jgi:hypothetical protein
MLHMNANQQPSPTKASMTQNGRILHQFCEVAEASGISPLTVDWLTQRVPFAHLGELIRAIDPSVAPNISRPRQRRSRK